MKRKKRFACCRPLAVTALFGFALLILDGCRKPGNGSIPGNNNQGEVTSVGIPTASAEQKTIGPSGGVFTTPDGSLSIETTAGAVAAETNFSVTPITGHCPLSPEYAWRIEPHHVTLSKPAKLSFRYSDDDTVGTLRALMAVAYQDENKKWRSAKIVAHDTAARKITVETNHFSDWSLYAAFRLISERNFVPPNGTTDLKVSAVKNGIEPYINGDLYIPNPDDFLSQEDLGKYIEDWQKAGEGTLIPNVTNATYVAPSTLPDINPVAISVYLKNVSAKYKLVILVANIVVGADNGVIVRIDGGPWHTANIPSQGVVMRNGLAVMEAHINIPATASFIMSWPAGSGGRNRKLSWGLPNPSLQLQFANEGYFHYIPSRPPAPSPGYIKFSKYEPTFNGDFTGSFFVAQGARLRNCVGCVPTTHSIEGRFRIKFRGN